MKLLFIKKRNRLIFMILLLSGVLQGCQSLIYGTAMLAEELDESSGSYLNMRYVDGKTNSVLFKLQDPNSSEEVMCATPFNYRLSSPRSVRRTSKFSNDTLDFVEECREQYLGLGYYHVGTYISSEGWSWDLNTANPFDLENFVPPPGFSQTQLKKIIQGRPYQDAFEIVKKGIISQTTYERIKSSIGPPFPPYFQTLKPSEKMDFVGRVVDVSKSGIVTVIKQNNSVKIKLAGITCPSTHLESIRKIIWKLTTGFMGDEVGVKALYKNEEGTLIGDILLFPHWENLSNKLIQRGLCH